MSGSSCKSDRVVAGCTMSPGSAFASVECVGCANGFLELGLIEVSIFNCFVFCPDILLLRTLPGA